MGKKPSEPTGGTATKADPTPDDADPALVNRAMLAALAGPHQEPEVDLLEYIRVVWQRRQMIALASLGTALLVALLSLLLPDTYRAEVLLAPVAGEESGTLPSLGQLGGLASRSGLLPEEDQRTAEHLAVLNSRTFIWQFVQERQLLPVLFANKWDSQQGDWKDPDPEEQPGMWDAHELFTEKGLLSASSDPDSGLVTVAVKWRDPQQAAAWANALVERLNEYLRQDELKRINANLKYLNDELGRTQMEEVRQSLFALISKEYQQAMLVNTQKEYAFRVIDAAEPPLEPSGPMRLLMVLVAMVLGGMIAAFVAFFQEGMRRRLDPATGAGAAAHG